MIYGSRPLWRCFIVGVVVSILGILACLKGSRLWSEVVVHEYAKHTGPRQWLARPAGTSGAPIKVFIGVFSADTELKRERRKLLRRLYGVVLSSGLVQTHDVLVLKHVIGATNGRHSQALLDENVRYGDLLLLDSPENIDDGKTFYFFRQLGVQARVKDHVLGHANPDDDFDFVMKLDDDSWLNIPELVRDLRRFRGLPEVYYGAPVISIGHEHHRDHHAKLFAFEYMTGMGYLLSKDLCHWLASDEALQDWPTQNAKYASWEDAMIGGWLFDKNKLANFIGRPRSRMADFRFGLPFNATYDAEAVAQSVLLSFLLRDLDQRMILVHQLKKAVMLQAVARWFWENPYLQMSGS